jgi:hypothetical protein
MSERTRTVVASCLLVAAFVAFAATTTHPVPRVLCGVPILWTIVMATARVRGHRSEDK